MAKRNVHVVPADGGWAVRRGGGERASRVESTQRQAIEQANRIGHQRVEVIIHGRDGRIREYRRPLALFTLATPWVSQWNVSRLMAKSR